MIGSEDLKWILERQLSWISSADSKLAVVGPLPLAMIAISFSQEFSDFSVTGWSDVPLIASTLSLLVSLYFSKLAITPRTKGPSRSVVYFGKISEHDRAGYKGEIEKINEQDFMSDLIDQIHVNAYISDEKHRLVQKAVFWIAFASPLWALSLAMEQ